jgi:hypothetical protein
MPNRTVLVMLDGVLAILQMFIAHTYLKVFFKPKRIKPTALYVAAYSIFAAALVALSALYPNMYLMLAATFTGVLAVSFALFDGHMQTRFFTALIFCVLVIFAEIISSGAIAAATRMSLSDIHQYGKLRLISSACANLVSLLLIAAISAAIGRSKSRSAYPRRQMEMAPLFVFLVYSVILLILCFYDTLSDFGRLSFKSMLEILAIVYMDIMVFWYYNRILQAHKLRHEQEVMSIYIANQMRYYELAQKQQDRLAAVRHDIAKHIKMMEGLLSGESSRQAIAYLDQYKERIEETEPVVQTPDPVVSVILSDCVARALEFGVEPELEVDLPGECGLEPVDITVILGNTIDNAIRALSKLPVGAGRQLAILFRRRGNILIYEIRNSCGVQDPEPGRTGYGLRNVRECAEKYRGELSAEVDGGVFTVTMILQV